jgi:hypothetical protein
MPALRKSRLLIGAPDITASHLRTCAGELRFSAGGTSGKWRGAGWQLLAWHRFHMPVHKQHIADARVKRFGRAEVAAVPAT